jgi:lysophospholipase L1-like esterase
MSSTSSPTADQRALTSALVPSLREDYSPEQTEQWMKRHQRHKARAREGRIDVLFVGDSITEGWSGSGAKAWQHHFASLRAAHFGSSGDRTQQVLWRLQQGELEGLSPQGIVLLIGTNNLDPGLGTERPTPANTPVQIVAGVQAICRLIQQQHPSARILLLGLLPRGAAGSRYRQEVPEVNRGLTALADGSRIAFLDVGHLFLKTTDEIPPEMMPDGLHLSESGYFAFATALRPVIDSLLHQSP